MSTHMSPTDKALFDKYIQFPPDEGETLEDWTARVQPEDKMKENGATVAQGQTPGESNKADEDENYEAIKTRILNDARQEDMEAEKNATVAQAAVKPKTHVEILRHEIMFEQDMLERIADEKQRRLIKERMDILQKKLEEAEHATIAKRQTSNEKEELDHARWVGTLRDKIKACETAIAEAADDDIREERMERMTTLKTKLDEAERAMVVDEQTPKDAAGTDADAEDDDEDWEREWEQRDKRARARATRMKKSAEETATIIAKLEKRKDKEKVQRDHHKNTGKTTSATAAKRQTPVKKSETTRDTADDTDDNAHKAPENPYAKIAEAATDKTAFMTPEDTSANIADVPKTEDDSHQPIEISDDDARALDEDGNLIDDDDDDRADNTLATIAQETTKIVMSSKPGKYATKRGSRGMVSVDALKTRAQGWVKTLFLDEKTKQAVLAIIQNFQYWDQHTASNNICRKIQKENEILGTCAARLKGIPDHADHFGDHHLRCKLIAIAAMADPDGVSIPATFYGWRTGKDELTRDWIDMLTQIQTLLHWKTNQRVRQRYMNKIVAPYVPPKAEAKTPKQNLPQIKKNLSQMLADEEQAAIQARATMIAQAKADKAEFIASFGRDKYNKQFKHAHGGSNCTDEEFKNLPLTAMKGCGPKTDNKKNDTRKKTPSKKKKRTAGKVDTEEDELIDNEENEQSPSPKPSPRKPKAKKQKREDLEERDEDFI